MPDQLPESAPKAASEDQSLIQPNSSVTNSEIAERGVFIVLEGTDGSGKGTQFRLLAERLTRDGFAVATFDFPQYDQPSSYFVTNYLNGAYGDVNEVGPYTASLFYALDRFESAAAIQRALQEGKVVLCNRFSASNMAHQGTKFARPEERRGFFIWLDNLEFEMLKIPRPDLNIVLRVPADTAQQLVDAKDPREYTDRQRDIHEADIDHLRLSVEVYDDLCKLFPKDFSRIDCVRGGQLLPIQDIQRLVYEKAQPFLPKPTSRDSNDQLEAPASLYTFAIPDDLHGSAREKYISTVTQLQDAAYELEQKVFEHLRDQASLKGVAAITQNVLEIHTQARQVSNLVRPLACDTNFEQLNKVVEQAFLSPALQEASTSVLPRQHTTSSVPPVTLTKVYPRNELDLIARILYQQSDMPLQEIYDHMNKVAYKEKQHILELCQLKDLADSVAYEWDILSDFTLFAELYNAGIVPGVRAQPITPRLGYDVPDIIENAGLSDDFETCFDISLQLYSQLQHSDHELSAHYVTLGGHRLRWSIVMDGHAVMRLKTYSKSNAASKACKRLANAVFEQIQETQPLVSACLMD